MWTRLYRHRKVLLLMTTSNSYEKIVNIVSKSAKLVAEETINDAAEELKGENVDNIVDVGVSCDIGEVTLHSMA